MASTSYPTTPFDQNAGSSVASNPLAQGGVISFITAGAILFASLVGGSLLSLSLSGPGALIEGIQSGFLSVGLWALAGFAVAYAVALAVKVLRKRTNERD